MHFDYVCASRVPESTRDNTLQLKVVFRVPFAENLLRTETLTQMSNVSPAMRSGTGTSVVNGRWAVDPPGEYKAGGTTFTYTRPRAQAEEERGETLRAAGPTSTQLQLYVSPPAREGYLR